MSDPTISADIISGIADAMGDIGWDTLKIHSVSHSSIDINNPGADSSQIIHESTFSGLVFDYDEKYMPGTTVLEGDQMVLISVDGMTEETIQQFKPGNSIIDGLKNYSIIKSAPIKVAGSVVVIIVQVK